MKNLKSTADVKKFRLLNRACSDMGLNKLLGSVTGLGNLNCELVLDSSITESHMKILRERGPMMKRFRLNARWLLKTDKDFVRYLFIDGLPQLESLTVVMNVWTNCADWEKLASLSILEPGDTLPNLKGIRFVYNGNLCTANSAEVPDEDKPKFLVEILTAAENLVQLTNVDCAVLRILKHISKLHLVTSLVWNDPMKIYYDTSMSSNLKLNSLTLCCTCSRCREQLMVILEVSKEVLSNFEIECSIIMVSRNNNDDLVLPKLNNVRTTRLYTLVCLGGMYGYSRLQTLFPNLDAIVIDSVVKHLFIMMPGWVGPVKSLNVKACIVEVDCFDDLQQLFPSLKSVQVRLKSWKRGPQDAKLYCLPKTVETIELCNFQISAYTNYALDEFFTGFPEQVCKSLRSMLKVDIDPQKFDGFSKYQSKLAVLSLPISVAVRRKQEFLLICFADLRLLKFYCVDKKLDADMKLVSRLSRSRALDLLPNLRLQFSLPVHAFQDSCTTTGIKQSVNGPARRSDVIN